MDPREVIREAVASGATGDELQRIIAQNLDALDQLPREEVFSFISEMNENDAFRRAYVAAAAFGEEKDEGLSSLLFGDPDSRLQTGIGPFFGGGGPEIVGRGVGTPPPVISNVTSAAGKSLLSKVGRALVGTNVSGFLKRLAGAGLAIGTVGRVLQDEPSATGGPSPGQPSGQTPTVNMSPGSFIGNAQGVQVMPSEEEAIPGVGPGNAGLASVEPRFADPGYNIMVVDKTGEFTGTPGSVFVVTPEILGENAIDTILAGLPAPGAVDAVAYAENFLVNTGRTANREREIMQVLFPESVGQVSFGTPTQLETTRRPAGELISQGLGGQFPQRGFREADQIGMPHGISGEQLTPQTPTHIPQGAKLSPRIFQTYNGRTLMEWASLAAQRHNVPLNLLYGLIDHESGWLSSAVGDNGTSFGLSQIHLPAWPGISKSQALNPVFALEWTAAKLSERFKQYGRWDVAVAAHNSPVAANYLASTGKFKDDKSRSYVTDILGRANDSGLSQYLFGSGADLPDTASAAAQYTPFQTPDPAASREYVSSVYDQLLGRSPTEQELLRGVKEIERLAKSSYDANLAQAKGQPSEGVDVEAQFVQGIKGTGEFAFHEETVDRQSFTDYVAKFARTLQQGA